MFVYIWNDAASATSCYTCNSATHPECANANALSYTELYQACLPTASGYTSCMKIMGPGGKSHSLIFSKMIISVERIPVTLHWWFLPAHNALLKIAFWKLLKHGIISLHKYERKSDGNTYFRNVINSRIGKPFSLLRLLRWKCFVPSLVFSYS